VEQESIISIYRVAPGQHVAFLQWIADREASSLQAGVAAGVELRQYVAWHTDTFAGGPMTASELLDAAQE
jgi:hypothetical protein